MYTESSSPARPGDKANLLSKVFPPVHKRCMTFSYSMYGLDIGALRIYLKEQQTNKEYKVWEKIGQQGKEWIEDSVDISSSVPYKVHNVHLYTFQIKIYTFDWLVVLFSLLE